MFSHRRGSMAAQGRALASRSGSGVGTRAGVAAAVAIFLGAIVTFPVWRTDGSEGNPTLAPGASQAEEALSALADLRKLVPEDADVRVLVKEHVNALLSGIKNLNRSGDRAQALASLDNLRKLAPDDAGVQALRDSIYDARRAITNTIGMKFELIPAGEFLMGSTHDDKDASDDEKPQHRVRITRPFYLGATEVTRGQFRRFVNDTGFRTEAETNGEGGFGLNEAGEWVLDPKYTWQNPGFEQTDEHPVVNVSWNDAVAFAAWLSRKEGTTYRLPTEAEWEYACRAGTTTKYSSGDDPESLATVGNIADGTAKEKNPNWTWAIAAHDGFVYTAPVGRYHPNAWKLFDMHGNVFEWCSDGYAADYYRRSPVNDPPGADGASFRVFRSECWHGTPRRPVGVPRLEQAGEPGLRRGLSPRPSPVRPLNPGTSSAGLAQARPTERRSRGAEPSQPQPEPARPGEGAAWPPPPPNSTIEWMQQAMACLPRLGTAA